jgi:3-dehydroquinate synthetase
MAAMGRDKKARAGVPRFVVLKALGQAVVRADVPADAVESVWRELGAA